MSQRSLRSTNRIRELHNLNHPPPTPTPVNRKSDSGQSRRGRRPPSHDDSSALLYFPSSQTLIDVVDQSDDDDDDSRSIFDNTEHGPSSVASSLDTPNNSPPHDPMESSRTSASTVQVTAPKVTTLFQPYALRKGPNLSDDSDDSSDDQQQQQQLKQQELQKQKELQKQQELKQKELQKQQELQKQKELQKQQELERQKQKELQRKEELRKQQELQKQKELQKQELQKQKELQKQQELQKQKELQKQQELERQKQKELQKQQELQKQKELQKQQELQRQQLQKEKELQRQEQLQRQQELQELQKQQELKRQQELEKQQEFQRQQQLLQIPTPIQRVPSKNIETTIKRRRVSASPGQYRNKKANISNKSPSPPRSTAKSRPSRPRVRVSSSKFCLTSSSSSSDASEPEPPRHPPKRERESKRDSTSEGEKAKERQSPPVSRNRKRPVPKTPSPSGSVERHISPPPPHMDRQLMSPSPFAPLIPPPTPSITPRIPSPLPSTSKPKREPQPTPQPSSKLARYDPADSPETDKGGVKTGKNGKTGETQALTALWEATESISVPNYQYVCTPGTIKSVTMVNIMSHKRFEKQWSPNFNFIIGENGSGKSAILSGIVAGLGGKAFDTGRATSMRDIIRNGQTKAQIEIVLNNYPSKLYGDDIKIVRTLSREGSSRYQIRDSNKVLRSLGRQELNLVLSKLNIQVDNPLAILHQEMSRNFLRTKDPSLLYGYFYRALLLSSCETLLKKSTADLQNAVACLKSKKGLLDDLRSKELELKKQVEVIEALRKGKQTLQKYENEHTWALVQEYEEVVKVAKQEFDVASRRLEEAMKEKAVCADKSKELENTQTSFEQVWQGVSDALITKTTEYEKKRRDVHSVRMIRSEVWSKLKIARDQVTSYNQNLASLQARVEEHQHNMKNSYERHMRELEARKYEYNTNLQNIAERIQVLRGEEEQLVRIEEQAVRIEEQQGYQLHDIKRKIEERKQEIRELERAKNTKYDVYGREMVKLMDKIEKTRFTKRPRGPLGCCFTVKDEKWAPLVEFIMEGSLHSFAVDNQEDRKILHRLIDEAYKETGRGRVNRNVKRPSLCLLKFAEKPMDITRGKASIPGHPTILDVIDIVDDDHVVFNWIIDSNRVERILLFESYAEACDLMKDRRKIPKSTLRGYSMDAYMFFPDPNFKALVQPKLKPTRFLKVTQQGGRTSMSTAEHLQRELMAAEDEYKDIFTTYSHFQKQTHAARTQVQQKSFEIKGWCTQQNQYKSELRTLETSVCNAPDIATWMEEIERTNQRIHAKEQERESLQREYEELQSKENTTELKIVEEEITALQLQQSNLLEQKNSAELKIGELQRDLRKKEAMCTNLHKIKMESTKKYKETGKNLKLKTDEALQKCERITELTGTAQEIKTRWETLNAELLKNQKKIGQREYIIRQYLNAKDIADKVKDEIQIMALLIRLAQPKIKLQQDHFRRKMLEYGISVGTCFRNLIKSRSYWGDLAISHEEKTLMCFVSLDTTSESRAKRNLEIKNGQQTVTSKKGIMEYACGMSGGERSFTTICFLIACWQLMDMPFYILDEFDVFMDTFNRRISQDILMNVAKSKPYAQFFIFTPLQLDTKPPRGAIILNIFKDRKGNQQEREDGDGEIGKKLLRIKGGS